MAEQQNIKSTQADSATEAKNSFGARVKGIILLVGICILLYYIATLFFPVGGNSNAQKEAELEVKNSVYNATGIIPEVESKIIYKNNDYICVGVKYAFDKADLKESQSHWGRIVCCFRSSGYVYSSSNDWGGVDVFNLSKDELEQVKVFFKLQ